MVKWATRFGWEVIISSMQDKELDKWRVGSFVTCVWS